ncbi:MAG: DUF2782 domain-containing protein [Pseudoxanthomonas sp.]
MKRALSLLLPILLTACATTPSASDDPPPIDVSGAQTAVHTESNGDTVEEYRVAGGLRMIKVKPLRGPAYYLYDKNGDGQLDSSSTAKNAVSPVYWKLLSW